MGIHLLGRRVEGVIHTRVHGMSAGRRDPERRVWAKVWEGYQGECLLTHLGAGKAPQGSPVIQMGKSSPGKFDFW